MIAHQDRGVLAPARVGRRPAAPERRLVDHVVVDEGRGVQQLDHAAQPHRAGSAGTRPGAPPAAAGSAAAACRRRPRCSSPISWMSGTGEFSSRRISASTAARSSPTSAATRSLRTRSRVGVATQPGATSENDAVAHLHLAPGAAPGPRPARTSRGSPSRAPVADLVVQLAQHLAGHRMHDGDGVATQAHRPTGAQAVHRGEVDDDPGRLHAARRSRA